LCNNNNNNKNKLFCMWAVNYVLINYHFSSRVSIIEAYMFLFSKLINWWRKCDWLRYLREVIVGPRNLWFSEIHHIYIIHFDRKNRNGKSMEPNFRKCNKIRTEMRMCKAVGWVILVWFIVMRGCFTKTPSSSWNISNSLHTHCCGHSRKIRGASISSQTD
jgi:hypothetical protein